MHIMRFPRMTTRRWMAVTAATSIALWLVIAAHRVKNDSESKWIFHLWERYGSIQPGSVYGSQHRAPFWPRYWRRLFGQPWPGNYACDPRTEYNGRWARIVVTVAASTSEVEEGPIRGRPPDSYYANRASHEYSKKYLPQHWIKGANGEWGNDYKSQSNP
jgi:hypothetical protein